MNNNQFRRLAFDRKRDQDGASTSPKQTSAPSTLGAKKSSFMPMTPRTVKGSPDLDFARQVRERNAASQPTKQFKAVAPKGVKYAAGYTDRAQARAADEDVDTADDKASRIKALEEQMKLGQIPEATFEALRDEITGGDISSTHLIKGLDWKLLERVRRGEDVLGVGGDKASTDEPLDVEEELEKLEEKEVEAVKRENTAKKGSMAPPPPVAGTKRTRDELMAELKAQRKAAAEAKVAPVFDSRWRKVGEEKNRIKIDHKGREVVITVDEDGVVKKKVRKVAKAGEVDEKSGLDMPDESKPVLGSDVIIPESLEVVDVDNEEDEDDDIFEGVGTAYDPLGRDDDEDSSDEETKNDDDTPEQGKPPQTSVLPESVDEPTAAEPNDAATDTPTMPPRNYFNDAPTSAAESPQDRMVGVSELLKKAAKMDSTRPTESKDENQEVSEEQKARLRKRAEMLAQQDRDLDDIDMGFGSSRYDDGEDEGDSKMRLSEWKGLDSAADDGAKGGRKGDDKKKRKPKKRKGDANSMADIMGVIEKRKAAEGK